MQQRASRPVVSRDLHLTRGARGAALTITAFIRLLLALLFITSAASATAQGVLQGTVFLHSGELQLTAVDLDAGGRSGWNVLVTRVYRSRTIGRTPVGMGWEASIFKRLRELPSREVEYRDGVGNVWLFKPQPGSASYVAPKGLFLRLARSEGGWRLVDQKWRITEFDQLGRLVSEGDAFAIPGNLTAGNTIRYLYGQDGQLASIVDPVGRVTRLTYYANGDASAGAAGGLLKEITDWRARVVTYLYDDEQRLIAVRLPAVPNATTGAGRPTIRYGYHAGAVSENDLLELAPNLVSITDPNEAASCTGLTEVASCGPPRVTFAYAVTGPNRDRIEKETWGTGETAAYTYVSPTQVEVKDALGQIRGYTIAGQGIDARVTAMVEHRVPVSTTPVGQLPAITSGADANGPAVAAALEDRAWTFRYGTAEGVTEPDGLLTNVTLAGVRSTDYTYQAAAGAPGKILGSTTTAAITASSGASLRAVTMSNTPAGAITRTFTYQGTADPSCLGNCATFLQSVAANGLAIDLPEAHRAKLEPVATNDSIEAKTSLDAQGRPSALTTTGGTDPSGSGSTATITYKPDNAPLHARGEIAEINRGGERTKFEYPTPDQVVIQEPRGITRTIDYDSWRRQTHVAITGPALTFDERFFYDASGRLVRHVRRQGPQDVTTTFAYDIVGREKQRSVDSIAAGSGTLTTTTGYDYANRKIVTTFPGGATVTRELDGLGRTQREVTTTGGSPIEHRFAYDRAGNPVFATDTLVATTSAFDVHGRELTTRFADGTTAHRTFDSWGRVTNVEGRSDGGAVVGETSLDITAAGRLKSITAKVDAGVTRQTAVRWDGAGRTTAVAAGNRAARASFDTSGRLVSSAVGEGSLAAITTPFLAQQVSAHAGTLPQLATTTEKTGGGTSVVLQYDTAANITSEQVGGLAWQQTFDQAGNVTSAALPARPAATYAYDARASLTQQTLPGGALNKYAYKENGALAGYTDPSNEAAVTVDVDLLGRPLKRTYADSTIEQLSYAGTRLETFTDRQGRTQVFAYNGKGQITRIDRLGGGQLDQLDYDEAGRLIRWTTKDAAVFLTNFNLAGYPKKTVVTRYKDGSGFTAAQVLGTYTQEHGWNEHGERVEWTMPRPSGFTTSAPWTDRVKQRYDAMGNVIAIERQLFGAITFAPFLAADYRGAERPITRVVTTHCGASCPPATILREYDYQPATGLLNEMRVRSGPLTVAGSRVAAFNGVQIAATELFGVSGTRTNRWSYDTRGRITSYVAGRTTSEDLSASDFRLSATRNPRLSPAARAALAANGGNPDAVDPPTIAASEAPNTGHAIAAITRGTTTREFTFLGGLRTDDGRFEYEWDEKGRLVRATEKFGTPAPLRRMRVSYAWDGTNRMVGRRVEVASLSSPTDWQLATPAVLTDGLPADATFVWDPLSDRIAAVFDSTTGALVRQVLHGGLGYDDPIEVTLTDRTDAAKPIQRLYPIYDEAGAGTLQAVLNMDGEVVSRTVLGDIYGDDRASVTGAAIDRIAISATKATDGSLQSVRITLRATEELRLASVDGGARLAVLDATGKVIRTSTAIPELADASTVAFTLSATDWTAFTNGAVTLSVAATNTLRAAAWDESIPILPAPDWATASQPVRTSTDLPVEKRDSITYLAEWLTAISAGSEATLTLYEVEDLGLLGSPTEADDPARFILASPLHALPFFDSVTRLSLARQRWLDHETGTFLTVDPLGFVDSANRYAYCVGDPVNCRDSDGNRARTPEEDRRLAKLRARGKRLHDDWEEFGYGEITTYEWGGKPGLYASVHDIEYDWIEAPYAIETAYQYENARRMMVEDIAAYEQAIADAAPGEAVEYVPLSKQRLMTARQHMAAASLAGTALTLASARGGRVSPTVSARTKQRAKYRYDLRAGRYRDTTTGRFAATRNLPYPPNAGFATRDRTVLQLGTIIDRYGHPAGFYAGQPGASISQRGLPPGSEGLPYSKYRVVRPVDVEVGPAATVPEFAAKGGGIQYLFMKPISQLVNEGVLEVVP